MEAEFCLLDCDYVLEEGKPVVRLWGRSEQGSVLALDRSARPYLFVEPKHPERSRELAEELRSAALLEERPDGTRESRVPEGAEVLERTFLGSPKTVVRVVLTRPADVPKFRELVKGWASVAECYEYGIPFARRYLIDHGLTPLQWASVRGEPEGSALAAAEVRAVERDGYPALRTLAFDIELIEQPQEQIIMVSLADSAGFRRVLAVGKGRPLPSVEYVQSEQELLERFAALLEERDPDIVVGYNSDRFDFAKISDAAARYKLPLALGRDRAPLELVRRGRESALYLAGRPQVDLYTFVENVLSDSLKTDVLSLDAVARELVGEGKEPMKWKEIEKEWRSGELSRLARYCLQDSQVTLKLAEHLLPQLFELCRVAGQTLFDVSRMSYSQLVEWLLIRHAQRAGELVPNLPKYAEVQSRRRAPPYTGGYVLPPKEGIHENIALFDFQALYPSIVITHNISPETLDCMCCTEPEKRPNAVPGSEHFFCARHRGFVAAVIEQLVQKRLALKRELAAAKGEHATQLENRQHALKILANASYGYYGYAGSRWYSRVCAESITAFGRDYIQKVIAFAQAKFPVLYGDTDSLFVQMDGAAIKPFLDQVNAALPGVMELDYKEYYKAGIFVLTKEGAAAKKRYALLDFHDRITIRGFERVRRDWSEVAKSLQEAVLLAVLRDRSVPRAVALAKEAVERVRSGSVPLEELVIHTQVTKPLSEYKQIGPHVVAAQKLYREGRPVYEGMTVSFVISKGSGSISERAEPMEQAKDYDPEYYVNNQVVPAALRVLSGLGVTEEQLSGTGQKKLSGFGKRKAKGRAR